MFPGFPVELTLDVLSYLQIQTISRLVSVSRGWSKFLDENQESVYHNVALLHAYVSSKGLSLEDAISQHHNQAFDNVAGWKEFCSSGVTCHWTLFLTS